MLRGGTSGGRHPVIAPDDGPHLGVALVTLAPGVEFVGRSVELVGDGARPAVLANDHADLLASDTGPLDAGLPVEAGRRRHE